MAGAAQVAVPWTRGGHEVDGPGGGVGGAAVSRLQSVVDEPLYLVVVQGGGPSAATAEGQPGDGEGAASAREGQLSMVVRWVGMWPISTLPFSWS